MVSYEYLPKDIFFEIFNISFQQYIKENWEPILITTIDSRKALVIFRRPLPEPSSVISMTTYTITPSYNETSTDGMNTGYPDDGAIDYDVKKYSEIPN